MSSLKEIITEESSNTHYVYLYREGIFYKAYDRSAYAWSKYICSYEVKHRYIKSIGAEVLSIGFPVKSLESKLEGHQYEINDERKVVVKLGEKEIIDPQSYERWREEICVAATNVVRENEVEYVDLDKRNNDDLLTEIISFPIETSSPIDCMMFLSELKRRYHNLKN